MTYLLSLPALPSWMQFYCVGVIITGRHTAVRRVLNNLSPADRRLVLAVIEDCVKRNLNKTPCIEGDFMPAECN